MKRLSIVAFGHSPLDPIKGAGGLLAKYAREGHTCTLVTLMRFDMKSILWPGDFPEIVTPDQVVTEVERQTIRSCEVLGVEALFMNYDTMRLTNLAFDEEAIIELTDLLRRLEADIVITHFPDEISYGSYHHAGAGIAVTKAHYYAARPELVTAHPHRAAKVLLYYIGDLLSPGVEASFHPDLYIDITHEAKQKHEAFAQFTHLGVPTPSILHESRMVHSRYHGQVSGCLYAEAFKLSDARFNNRIAFDRVPDDWLREAHHQALSLPADFV